MKVPFCVMLWVLFAGLATAWAADPPTREMLRTNLADIPRCSVEWKVVSVLKPNPAATAVKVHVRPGGVSENERQKAEANASAAMTATLTNGAITPMAVHLDYYAPDRYFISEVVGALDQASKFEHYSDGNGVVYVDELNLHHLRLISGERASSLVMNAFALPEVSLHFLLGDVKDWKPGPAKAGFVIWTGASPKWKVVRLWLDAGAQQIVRVQTGTAELAQDTAEAVDHVFQEVEFRSYRQRAGYTLPEEVVCRVYRGRGQVDSEQTWNLQSFIFEPKRELMRSPQYQLKPRYHITDETVPGTKRLKSDDLLLGK